MAVCWGSLVQFVGSVVGLVTILLTLFLLITPPLEVGGGASSSPLEVGGGDGFSLFFEGLAWMVGFDGSWS